MKQLVTAQDIHNARKAGQGAIVVAKGALITPQARDDAKSYGIALQQEAENQARASHRALSVPAAGTEPLSPARPGSFIPTVVPPAASRAAVNENIFFPRAGAMNESVTTTACNASSVQCPIIPGDAIARQVAEQIAARTDSRVDMARINAVLAEVLAERGIASATSFGATLTTPATLVRLPERASTPDAVTITDSLPSDAQGPGVGYLKLNDTAFEWTFAAAEVLVVLEGELRVTGTGLELRAGPGEALRLNAGLRCTVSAVGRVVCVYSAWPK